MDDPSKQKVSVIPTNIEVECLHCGGKFLTGVMAPSSTPAEATDEQIKPNSQLWEYLRSRFDLAWLETHIVAEEICEALSQQEGSR